MSLSDQTEVVSISSSLSTLSPSVALLWKNLSVYEPKNSSKRRDAAAGVSSCSPASCWPSKAHGHQVAERRILKGLNGAIMKRSLTAIMGPSGAGKT